MKRPRGERDKGERARKKWDKGERVGFIAMSAWWIRHVLFVGCAAGEFALIIFPSTDTFKSMWHSGARKVWENVRGTHRNLGQTGGATAPPSCQRDEIRSKSSSEDSTISDLLTRKHSPLPAPVITFLQANMSSLHCNFSYADVPSRVSLPVLWKAAYCFMFNSLFFLPSCIFLNLYEICT